MGSVAKAKTTASSGQPEVLKAVATLRPKLEALMESTAAAALASPETAKTATDKDAQMRTQHRNFTGVFSNMNKPSSSSSIGKINASEEALLAFKAGKE